RARALRGPDRLPAPRQQAGRLIFFADVASNARTWFGDKNFTRGTYGCPSPAAWRGPRCAGRGVPVVDTGAGPGRARARRDARRRNLGRPRALEPRNHHERGDAYGRRAALQRLARARRARQPCARARGELARGAGWRRLSLPASRWR